MYTQSFYDTMYELSKNSAEQIIPLVIQKTGCQSVIDVGCGNGSWLTVFQSHNVQDVLGVDGDYVSPETLEIAPDVFFPADLSQPLIISRRFDLAISMEVGEHLPAESAQLYVQGLCQLAPIVLFSAAIPGQGGVHHVNEQWPDYWATLFEAEGFVMIDNIRPHFWENNYVAPWYAQNTFMYVSKEHLSSYPLLETDCSVSWDQRTRIVHPNLFAYKESLLHQSKNLEGAKLRDLMVTQTIILRQLPGAIKKAIAYRTQKKYLRKSVF